MLQTPDGHGTSTFRVHPPDAIETEPTRPNEIGMHRVAFPVDDIDEALEIAERHDCHPLRGVANVWGHVQARLCPSPSGILVMLAEELKKKLTHGRSSWGAGNARRPRLKAAGSWGTPRCSPARTLPCRTVPTVEPSVSGSPCSTSSIAMAEEVAMGLRSYGVLAGRVIGTRAEGGQNSPHFQIHVDGGGEEFRVAVNVLSQLSPPELLYVALEHFAHPMLEAVARLPDGITEVPSAPGGVALDLIRGNLVDRTALRPMPATAPGPDNDLADKLDHFAGRAAQDPAARVFAFGERWGPEPGGGTRCSASGPATACTTST